MDKLVMIREVTYLAVILRIVAAVLVGGIIGFEREMKNRAAGLRTYILVCVGSCMIMLTNQYLFQVSGTGDPMRLGAQVVSGIGFLGAGTIIVTKHNQIKGLTTAAGLWAAAGVGLALGVGFYEAALIAGLLIFFVLTGLQKLDNRMRSKTKTLEVYIEMSDSMNIGTLIRSIREMNVEIKDVQLEHDTMPEDGTRSLFATLKCKKRTDHIPLMEAIRKIKGIVYLEEL